MRDDDERDDDENEEEHWVYSPDLSWLDESKKS